MGLGIKAKLRNAIVKRYRTNCIKTERLLETNQNLKTIPSSYRIPLTSEEQNEFEKKWGG